jgi:hypothetical protein
MYSKQSNAFKSGTVFCLIYLVKHSGLQINRCENSRYHSWPTNEILLANWSKSLGPYHIYSNFGWLYTCYGHLCFLLTFSNNLTGLTDNWLRVIPLVLTYGFDYWLLRLQ